MATISEDYVSFECAKLLKDKGFAEKCRTYFKVFPEYRIAAIYHSSENRGVSEDDPNEILCPTLQMAMKWLREVHNLFIEMHIQNNGSYIGYIYNTNGFGLIGWDKRRVSSSYEQACEIAIKYCLENLI